MTIELAGDETSALTRAGVALILLAARVAAKTVLLRRNGIVVNGTKHVPVMYDPHAPHRALRAASSRQITVPLAFAGGGLLLVATGLGWPSRLLMRHRA